MARRSLALILTAVVLPMGLTIVPAGAATGVNRTAVLQVGQIARENVAPRLGSEPDTLVEPDVAVSPVNPQVAVAAFHDGRYSDGGAVDVGYAWTSDGGRTWRDAPVPYLTQAVGGRWARASDPVLAFAADGTVYLSVLVFSLDCPSGITVQRSTDGGATWSRPVLVHVSGSCTYSDDKNWITVDTQPASPHLGRVYQFWTPFRFTAAGRYLSSPQAVRWSDDAGRHWSQTSYVSGVGQSTQDSQPMIRPDGTLVDAYLRFPVGGHDDPEHQAVAAASTRARSTGTDLVARTSRDGGSTWSGESLIRAGVGEGPPDVRCCLASAVADPVTGLLYANWIGAGAGEPVLLSRSTDGSHWSTPIRVDRDGSAPATQHVNSDVTAYAGRVFVSYGGRSVATAGNAHFVHQTVSWSTDRGLSFHAPVGLGPPSDLRYAAFARALFPGDYIGTAATDGRVYLVWARSSRPSGAHPGPYHQVIFGATLSN